MGLTKDDDIVADNLVHLYTIHYRQSQKQIKTKQASVVQSCKLGSYIMNIIVARSRRQQNKINWCITSAT